MEPPLKPDEADCCNSGCNPCILDVYEVQIKAYNEYMSKRVLRNVTFINAIKPTSYTNFELIDRQRVSQTVYLLKFQYSDKLEPTPNVLQYKAGQYFLLRGKDYNGEFTRAYTPILLEQTHLELTFSVLIRFYDNGRMSKLLKEFEIGELTAWRGPYGTFTPNFNYKFIVFIAQGTGIAPIYSIINELVQNEECELFVHLFYCCRNTQDILLRDELYKLGSFWNFSYEIFLSQCDALNKKYNEILNGFKLNSTHINSYIKDKIGLMQVAICGSDHFSETMKGIVEVLGVIRSDIYIF